MSKKIKDIISEETFMRYQELSVKVDDIIPKHIQDRMMELQINANKAAEKFLPLLEKAEKRINKYLPKMIEAAERATKWQNEQKITVNEMAQMGWFPIWCTFNYSLNDAVSFDDMMVNHIDQDLNDIKNIIYEYVPNRKHILEVAFLLHEDGNYIASIPLFLSQADGICSEEFRHFFSKDSIKKKDGTIVNMNASDEIIKQVENGDLIVNFMTEKYLEPFKVDLQLTKGSTKASKKSAKENGPNRHGIIHGSKKHLDYGTKLNGYKALSFLAFIVFTTK